MFWEIGFNTILFVSINVTYNLVFRSSIDINFKEGFLPQKKSWFSNKKKKITSKRKFSKNGGKIIEDVFKTWLIN